MTALLPNPWDSDNSVPLDVEQAIEAIQTSRRRHVLLLVDERNCPVSVNDLSEAIAAIEQDKEVRELHAQERKRVYVSLIQVHLDTLNEIGAIAYDAQGKQTDETEATAGLADIVRHIESVCEMEVSDGLFS
jgi:uncharacterized protein (UPF0305 family)